MCVDVDVCVCVCVCGCVCVCVDDNVWMCVDDNVWMCVDDNVWMCVDVDVCVCVCVCGCVCVCVDGVLVKLALYVINTEPCDDLHRCRIRVVGLEHHRQQCTFDMSTYWMAVSTEQAARHTSE